MLDDDDIAAYRQKIESYRAFLVDDLEPGKVSDLAVGSEQYERLLENHFLDYTVDEMVSIGTRLYKETEELMQRTAAEIDPTKTWQELIDATQEQLDDKK